MPPFKEEVVGWALPTTIGPNLFPADNITVFTLIRPSDRINIGLNISMIRRIRPVTDAINIAMFDRIKVNIINCGSL
jgi:hypothetical protein